ncbi:MAG: winged helix-turn-helix transcriptional regulator [Proteobacteria bacterium]|nr:winged helix-turn-helix transcriptional regulator [Pseudomonadota bacterium]
MENTESLNRIFRALTDPTRRQIISMLVEREQRRISDLADPFAMSLAAVSKHIQILERAALLTRVKRGREYYLQLNAAPLREAKEWLGFYEKFWRLRFAKLESLLDQQSIPQPGKLEK